MPPGAAGLAPLSPTGEQYLNLVEMAVTGSLTDEAGRCQSDSQGCALDKLEPFDSAARDVGRDWPPFGHTMVGHSGVRNVRQALEWVIRDGVPGDFAELGVWRGGTCIMARAVLDAYGQHERRVHAFDAFGALPMYGDPRPGSKASFLSTTLASVRHNFHKYGLYHRERVHFHQGLFSQTVPRFRKMHAHGSLAVLRVDGNVYSSYQDALYYLYELVAVGGIVILDDIGHDAQVKLFWQHFTQEQGVTEELHTVDWTRKWIRKQRNVTIDWSHYRRDVGLSYKHSSHKRAHVATQPERASASPASPAAVRAETATTASAVLWPQYQPSPVERKWARLVAEVDPRECQHAWSNGSRLMARLERDVASSAVFKQSSSFTVGPESQGSALDWTIEPLVSFLRWPAALSPGHATRAAIMNKSYYQLAPVRAGSRRFFFDIGASLYSSSRAGGDGGSSLRWFWSRYQNLTGSPQPFDHIYAWEASEYNATVVWDSFPAQVVPFVSYYNVRADARPNAKHNPLRVLKQVARLDDHVVIKLDVDHQATQVALIQQVLGNRRISALIDELFWEHEVAGSAMGCPQL